MPESKEHRILEAAIELFAEHGYAVSIKQIAHRADSTPSTVYRACRRKKENLFDQALAIAIQRSLDPRQFTRCLYEHQKYSDLFSVLFIGLKRWYFTINWSSARLLKHADSSDNPKWEQMANAAVERVISTLVDIIKQNVPKTHKFFFDTHTTASSVIETLLRQKSKCLPKGHSRQAQRTATKQVELIIVHNLTGLNRLINPAPLQVIDV